MSYPAGLRKLETLDRLAKTIAGSKRRLHGRNLDRLDGIILGHGDFRYRVDLNWVNSSGLGNSSTRDYHEMVIDSEGRIFVLSNDYQNNILIVDPRGEVVDRWTLGLEGAHGLTIAQDEGGECLFITDYKTQSVFKTTLWGQVLMKISAPIYLDVYCDDQPYLPTGTAVSSNGDIYIADGYGSSYVIQFSAEGRYKSCFGGRGSEPYSINCAHGIAIDPRGGSETLLVTSREEACIKRFSLEGRYLETINVPGAYMCRPVVSGAYLYTAVCWSHKLYSSLSGFISLLNDKNEIVSNPGGIEPGFRDECIVRLRQSIPLFRHCHDVAVDTEGNLYVCEWNAGGRLPIKLERQP